MNTDKFEDKLKRLKEIVGLLENGELDLDSAVKIYTEGAELALECRNILNSAEQKVKAYTENTDGSYSLSDFEVEK